MSQRTFHSMRRLGLGSALFAALTFAAGAGPAAARPMPQPTAQPALQLDPQDFFPGESQGFLGVGVTEVTPDQAKQLKLNPAYGVMVSSVEANSPAAKAGLKQGDVITEYNGMRVEGVAEFRRLVRETPPGHSAQITIWRDGHGEKLSAEIGAFSSAGAPQPNAGRPNTGPKVPYGGPNGVPNVPYGGPNVPYGGPNGGRSFGPRFAPGQPPALFGRGAAGATPALGVAAQNLSGQLGEYGRAARSPAECARYQERRAGRDSQGTGTLTQCRNRDAAAAGSRERAGAGSGTGARSPHPTLKTIEVFWGGAAASMGRLFSIGGYYWRTTTTFAAGTSRRTRWRLASK